MRTDGFYRSTAAVSSLLHDWLQFVEGGMVLAARTGPDVASLVRWFGPGEHAFADAQGTYQQSGDQLTLQLPDYPERGVVREHGLELAGKSFLFVPSPSIPSLPAPSVKEATAPTGLTAHELRWWELAQSKGWHCQRCGAIPLLADRECWLETGLCTECAIEAFR